MAYTATNWLEMSMTTAQKLTALDNLEGMYTEAVSYIDAITHSSLYYTDAQAAARYFGVGNDGTGSGLIAATLDGYTSEQIIAAGSPSGVIGWWSGSEISIPSGWVLCNGLNSTPDLRNRFVVGAGSHYAKGATGGSNTVTTTGTVTIAGHALTAAETPKHTHTGIIDYWSVTLPGQPYPAISAPNWLHQNGQSNTVRNTESTGGGEEHVHDATWTGTSSQDRRPPYYALCFIMKS